MVKDIKLRNKKNEYLIPISNTSVKTKMSNLKIRVLGHFNMYKNSRAKMLGIAETGVNYSWQSIRHPHK